MSAPDISATPSSTSNRGPGLKRNLVSSISLPTKPTLDFAHVDPAGFAAALEKKPERIFEFMRDQIGYKFLAAAFPNAGHPPSGLE